MAALAQNGDGLRADQAGAANDDDLNGDNFLYAAALPDRIGAQLSSANNALQPLMKARRSGFTTSAWVVHMP